MVVPTDTDKVVHLFSRSALHVAVGCLVAAPLVFYCGRHEGGRGDMCKPYRRCGGKATLSPQTNKARKQRQRIWHLMPGLLQAGKPE